MRPCLWVLSFSIAAATGPGVALVVHPGQVLEIQVSIDLGGGDIRVPQQFLDGTEVATGFQQVAGKGVPQQVRMQPLVRSLEPAPPGQSGLNATPAQTLALTVHEQRRLRLRRQGRAHRQPGRQGSQGFATDRQQPLLVALAQYPDFRAR